MNVEIYNNNSLVDLSGLERLTTINNSLKVESNDLLSDLSGLTYITSIGGELKIQNNNILTDLTGLESITETSGDSVFIHGNDSLRNFVGLNNLRTINANLIISNNINLKTLSGLDSLKSINGKLWISDNKILNNINSISDISIDTISQLHIFNNYELSTCDIQSICTYLDLFSSKSYIYNNASGCSNNEEVIEQCTDGILNGHLQNTITIYPNPATCEVTIQNINHHKNYLRLIYTTT